MTAPSIRYANTRAGEVFGFAAEELLGQPVEVLVPDAYAGAHVAQRDEYLEAPTPRAFDKHRDLKGRRKDGTEFAVEVGLTPLATPSGPWVVVSVLDISLRAGGRGTGAPAEPQLPGPRAAQRGSGQGRGRDDAVPPYLQCHRRGRRLHGCLGRIARHERRLGRGQGQRRAAVGQARGDAAARASDFISEQVGCSWRGPWPARRAVALHQRLAVVHRRLRDGIRDARQAVAFGVGPSAALPLMQPGSHRRQPLCLCIGPRRDLRRQPARRSWTVAPRTSPWPSTGSRPRPTSTGPCRTAPSCCAGWSTPRSASGPGSPPTCTTSPCRRWPRSTCGSPCSSGSWRRPHPTWFPTSSASTRSSRRSTTGCATCSSSWSPSGRRRT